MLNDVLPTAFAIVKETARRFTENESVSVTSTEFDRALAVKNDFVNIVGDQAVYKNMELPKNMEWAMVHDAQLIGGVARICKIAEMQTGEGKTLSNLFSN